MQTEAMLSHRKKHEDSAPEQRREAGHHRLAQSEIPVANKNSVCLVSFAGTLHAEPIGVYRVHRDKPEENQGDLRSEEYVLVDWFALRAEHAVDRHHSGGPRIPRLTAVDLSFNVALPSAHALP